MSWGPHINYVETKAEVVIQMLILYYAGKVNYLGAISEGFMVCTFGRLWHMHLRPGRFIGNNFLGFKCDKQSRRDCLCAMINFTTNSGIELLTALFRNGSVALYEQIVGHANRLLTGNSRARTTAIHGCTLSMRRLEFKLGGLT
jgi:hypothetical protein